MRSLQFVFFIFLIFFSSKKKEIQEPSSNISSFGERKISLIVSAPNVPGIKDQPISGKGILVLYPYDGSIYIGYGDGGANTGPIGILSYNITKNIFEMPYKAMTEDIIAFKEIGGDLYVPNEDPHVDLYGSVFLYDKSQKLWKKKKAIPGAGHIYSVVDFKDKIFICTGSDGPYPGMVASTTDKGDSWQIEHSTSHLNTNADYVRYIHLAATSTELFTSGFVFGSEFRQFGYLYRDGNWIEIKNIPVYSLCYPFVLNDKFFLANYRGPVKFGGGLKQDSSQYVIDADTLKKENLIPKELSIIKWDKQKLYNTNIEYLWVLFINKSSGACEIYNTADFRNWNKIIALPQLGNGAEYTAITYFENNIYLGTSTGDLYLLKEIYK